MPKAIKKKTVKQAKKEENLTTVLSTAKRFRSWEMHYRIAAIAVPLVILLTAGFYFYGKTASREADKFQYEGYKLFYGLYQAKPMPGAARYEQAAENFMKAYREKGSPVSLYFMAASYYELGRYEEAAAALTELNAKFPDDERFVPLTYYKMAMIKLRQGGMEEALRHLETLYNYKTASYKDLSLMESARILKGMGRNEEAKRKYEALLKDFPNSPFAKEAEENLKG